jgi:predicted MPP superfamily phosphohydrolase
VIALEIGSAAPLRVREELVGDGGRERWQVLFASDLHLNPRRTHLIDRLCDALATTEPLDAILLGGDLVDDQSGADALEICIARLGEFAPVLAVPGNHDARAGLARVREAVLRGGGRWLPDAPARLDRDARRALRLHATLPRARTRTRTHAAGDIEVLLAHHPDVCPIAARSGCCDIVLAGHLHGGQCVLWEHRGLEYPGAFLSRWNGPRFQLGSATMLVSRGVADTLPIRFRCPREVLVCRIG